jgi:hypothetical protein
MARAPLRPLVSNPNMIRFPSTLFSPFPAQNQPRGNATSVQRMIAGNSPTDPQTTYTTTFTQYDEAGNVVKTVTPNGLITSTTTVSYTDDFGSGIAPGSGVQGPNGATYAFPTMVTNSLGQVVRTQYDYIRGVPTGVKDPNQVVTKTEYNDPYDRPTKMIAGNGLSGSETAITQYTYPTPSFSTTSVVTQLDDPRWLAYKNTYDGFGQPLEAAQSEDGSGATYTITVQRINDGLGRARFETNPHRSAGASSDGWTRTTYDLAGRVTEVASFVGSCPLPLLQTQEPIPTGPGALLRPTPVR